MAELNNMLGPSVEAAEVEAAEGAAAAAPVAVAVAPAAAPIAFSRLAAPEATEASPRAARKLAKLKKEEGHTLAKRAQQEVGSKRWKRMSDGERQHIVDAMWEAAQLK